MSDISPSDVVLALLKNHGGQIKGRTVLQKLAYFCSVMLKQDLGYSPHYFGPFSRQVESAADQLALSGLVSQNSTVIGSNNAGMPIRHYSYELSDEGNRAADQVIENQGNVQEVARIVCARVGEYGDDRSAQPLSLAAKVHFVLHSRQRPMTADEIRTASQGLGWDVSEWQIKNAITLLERLGLVATDRNEQEMPQESA